MNTQVVSWTAHLERAVDEMAERIDALSAETQALTKQRAAVLKMLEGTAPARVVAKPTAMTTPTSPRGLKPKAPNGQTKAKVAALVHANPGITCQEVMARLNISIGTAISHFRNLKNQGVIRSATLPRKPGHGGTKPLGYFSCTGSAERVVSP